MPEIISRPKPSGDVYSFTWQNPKRLFIRFAPAKGSDTVTVLSVLPEAPVALCDIRGWAVHAVDGLAVGTQGRQRIQERLKASQDAITLSFSKPDPNEVVSARAKELVTQLTDSTIRFSPSKPNSTSPTL